MQTSPSILPRALLAVVLGLCAAAQAAEGPPSADLVAVSSPEADRAWAELQPLLEFNFPAEFASRTQRQKNEWIEQQLLLMREKGVAFMQGFPDEPRRWNAAWALINRPPGFIKSYGPKADTDYDDVVIDEAAAAAWRAKLTELEASLLAAPDVPADVRVAFDRREVSKLIRARAEMMKNGAVADWTPVMQGILAMAAKYPAADTPADAARAAMYLFEMAHLPPESVVAWRTFAASPNAKLAELARGKQRALAAISGPVELAFTALDGREVDTRKLRGKVVLIDFWATWCGPCMAEMPNVKKVYAAYRDQGFEIIGISCDVAPEHASKAMAKIARTGPQVLEFCRKNDMPWPQHYEGRRHNEGGNSLATRFAVTGIPAAFLLDQNGNVVAMNLRGEKLEVEVKRLLKL